MFLKGFLSELKTDKLCGTITFHEGEEAFFSNHCLQHGTSFLDLTLGMDVYFYVHTTHNGILAVEVHPAETQEKHENRIQSIIHHDRQH